MATTAQITQAYRDILGREPDAEGLKYWAQSGQNINAIRNNIQLGENQQIAQLYKDILGREPDAEGLKYWAESGQDLGSIARNIGINKQQDTATKAAQPAAQPSAQPAAQPAGKYSIKEFTAGMGGDSGYYTEYALVDPSGEIVSYVKPTVDYYGQPSGQYQIDNSTGGGEGGGSTSYTTIDLDAINARAAKGAVPFGTAMGPALGYAYEMKNSGGDVFRRFDAQGNLTEFLDQNGVFQPASSFQPQGLILNPNTGTLETAYSSPNSTRLNITESSAVNVNPYHEDQGGWLGEGGWKNLAGLALTGLSAGFAAPVMGALQGAGLGSIASGALYGGLTGAASGAISGGGRGALQGGLLGAAGGGVMGALGGGGDVAQAFPVNVSDPSFSSTLTGLGSTTNNALANFGNMGGLVSVGASGLGNITPDVSNYLTQLGSTGSEALAAFNAFNPNLTYSANSAEPDADSGTTVTEEFDPNTRVLTAEEAENLMLYDILPADMQTPASFSLIDSAKALLGGDYGSLIKGGLTLGGLAAASALKQNSQPTSTGSTGLTSGELQQIVSGMPSMVDKYNSGAAIPGVPVAGGLSQINAGYNQGMTQSLANLFPTFSLPTQGPFYGAGRFGNNYAPAPITSLV